MSLKLNVLLGKTDHLASAFKNNVKDFLKFFKEKQGAFKGEHKTYAPRDNMIDEPTKRGTVRVVTTVDEKLSWLESNQADYLNGLFAQERTNSSGTAKAELVVGNVSFGELTSLELLRLKSVLESGEMKEMYESIPVRSDAEVWDRSTNPDYTEREIWETRRIEGIAKSTQKTPYILDDPNIAKLGAAAAANYKPVTASNDVVIEVGDYTTQKFSGEYSHLQRANILKRRSELLTAVVSALKVANNVDVVDSPVTSQKIFDFLHRGQ